MKSLALLLVSVHPFAPLKAALVLLAVGAGPVPLKQFAVPPYPRKSTMFASVGQEPVKAVVFLTRATLPAPAAIAIVPIASGVGRDAPLLPPLC